MNPDVDRPKTSSLRPLRALAEFITPYRRVLALALAALLLAAAAQLSLPIALRFLVDHGMLAESAEAIDRYFLAMFVAGVAFGVFSALRFYLVTWLGERVVADVRNAVYGHVIELDPSFFEVTKTGEVLSRLTTDTTLIQSISGAGLSIVLRSAVTLVGGLIMLAITSPRLTGMILLLVPLVVAPIIVVGRKVRTLSRASQDRVADTSGIAGETLNAVAMIQAFTLEPLQKARFGESVSTAFATAVRRIRVRAVLTAIAVVFIFGAITFVLWLGTRSVMSGEMTSGELGQFLLYAIFVAAASAGLSEMWGEVQRASGAMERLAELIDTEPAIASPDDPVALPERCEGRISFDAVTFTYPSRRHRPALENISLDIDSGEVVAIVGPSGAGKSTMVQLMLRFYDPQSGSIRLDGVDISRADPREVRARVGLVPQETVIFGATVRENIRYGRTDATDDMIEAAARAAAADDFIRRLPDGYDTFLGERGVRLSGGQRQRVAIARAFLKDPPILLLDEATSALDAESERLVQRAMMELMSGRTTIVIAHRLATVQKADRIVVMDEGRIVDVGAHDELVARNALYGWLAELQFSASEPRVFGEMAE